MENTTTIIPISTAPPPRLTPEKARQVLDQHGMQVDKDQAKVILEFLRMMAKIGVN